MRWALEFLLGASFWVGFFFLFSEVIELQPGERPPFLLQSAIFAILFGRVMLYLRREDRNIPAFAVCHLAAALTGIALGFALFPPPSFAA